MRRPFSSAEAVAHYLDADEIECLECGRLFQFLPRHIKKMHAMTAVSYRLKWGLPSSEGLAGRAYRAQQSAKMSRMIAGGMIVPAHAKATEAARASGTRRKVDWQAVLHSADVGAARPGDHSRLPPGAKRTDGRDADRAREYQRQYRARKNDH